MFTTDQVNVLIKSSTDFVFFTNNVFSKSSGNFVGGKYIDDSCRFLSSSKRTMKVSARHHSKSYLFYSHFMWKLMFEGADNNLEAHYFSFNEAMAAYHIGKIKQCIENNPYFKDLKDAKPTAETILKYTWNGKTFVTLHPHGLTQFKRGIHAQLIYVDDPFQDPANDMNASTIYTINDIFKSNIIDMPSIPDGELHVAGTSQTKDDFFFDPTLKNEFNVTVLPAIYKDKETGEDRALWPEWKNLESLRNTEKSLGPAKFSREYLCEPVQSTKAFFTKEYLREKTVNNNLVLKNAFLKNKIPNFVIAGFDIGKKTHPSHLVVLEQQGNKLVLIHHKFMDGWNYANGKTYDMYNPTQLEYIKMCIDNFNIQILHYDDTRGEFQAFDEQGMLPREMVPIIFSNKTKSIMSAAFDKVVFNNQLVLPNEERLLDQICLVNKELQAVENSQGHADPFWSISLALMGAPEIIGMQDSINSPKIRRGIKVGSPGVMDGDIPKNW